MIFVGHHTIAVLSAKASEKLIFFIKISTVFGKKFLVCSEQTIAFVLLSYLPTPVVIVHILMVTRCSCWEGPHQPLKSMLSSRGKIRLRGVLKAPLMGSSATL